MISASSTRRWVNCALSARLPQEPDDPGPAAKIGTRFHSLIEERITAGKWVPLEPLDEQGVRDAVRELKDAGVQAIAICFLFSYLDPAHEARAMEIVREDYPECFATTSSSVSPQFREFERFTTTAMNAFVGPKVRNYVTKLESDIEKSGFKADLRIMASNGGVATPAMVAADRMAGMLR